MRNLVLVYKYSIKDFMDVLKIKEFKENIKNVDHNIKFVFYGNGEIEEMNAFISFFNLLVGKNVCDFALSLNHNALVFEKGVNNKAIKKSVNKCVKITENETNKIIINYYSNLNEIEIHHMPVRDWQSTILDYV